MNRPLQGTILFVLLLGASSLFNLSVSQVPIGDGGRLGRSASTHRVSCEPDGARNHSSSSIEPLFYDDNKTFAVTVKDVAEIFQPFLRSNDIREVPDDEDLSLSSSYGEAETYQMVHTVGDKPIIRAGEPGNLEFQFDEKCPNNYSSTPSDQSITNHRLLGDDYIAVETSNRVVTEVTYGNVFWLVTSVLAVMLVLWFCKSKMMARYATILNGLRRKQHTAHKKKKSRKPKRMKNGAVGIHEKTDSFKNEKEETASRGHSKRKSLKRSHSFDAGDCLQIGELLVSNFEIEKGSNGTVIFKGAWDGRRAAVKRVSRAYQNVADQEAAILKVCDNDPNIVRLHGRKEDENFVYIALERCAYTLYDLVQQSSSSGNSTFTSTNERKVPLRSAKGIRKDLNLWSNDFSSPRLLKLMRGVVCGLRHLHGLRIIHQDLKPQNILIGTNMIAKISDMGMSRRLPVGSASLFHCATECGSSGWQAPEQLSKSPHTCAVDLFSLGCIIFFCLTKGQHPFGENSERDSNIMDDCFNLLLVEHIPEAVDLVSQLLNHTPDKRPSAAEVDKHPFFWDSQRRLSFFREASDHLEAESSKPESDVLKALENATLITSIEKWADKLDAALITNLSCNRKYALDSTRGLLRVIRNKQSHFKELPTALQELMERPEGFDKYFSSRFPGLLIEVYKVIHQYCSNVDALKRFFED